jgi:uncharacterized membrane-anchored protein
MRKKLTHALAAALAFLFAPMAYADGPGDAGPDVAAPPVRSQPPPPANAAALDGRTGQIALDDIVLNVPAGYKFYPASEAYAYLQRNNAATPPGAVLGLVARDGADVRQPGTWATVVSYDAIGYVQRETAPGLSDAGFEASVRDARNAQNRPFEGFAMEPEFDAAAPALSWAERAARPGSQGADLRTEDKLLGRNGVAGLTSIGSADQMGEMLVAASTLRGMLSFPAGRRHADFDPASDQVSAFTVPALVTGIAAQTDAAPAADTGQTGFGGLAGWFPWIAVGAIGLAIAGYMLMRGRREEDA